MNKKREFTTQSALATQKLGEEFADELKPGDILLLYGDLGFGKTTFVQGLAKGLGIEKRIISPTFVIVRRYACHPGGQRPIGSKTSEDSILYRPSDSRVQNDTTQETIYFYHIDLYRTETEGDLKSVGLKEILNDQSAIKLIEWPEKLGSTIPMKRLEVHFNYINENEREITIKKYD